MARDQDPIGALIAYLKTQSNVTDHTSTRIFGQELPRSEVSNMPRKCVVIASAGGVRGHIGATTYREVRIDVMANHLNRRWTYILQLILLWST